MKIVINYNDYVIAFSEIKEGNPMSVII